MVRQLLALATIASLGVASVVQAEVKKDKELPRSGVLSSTTQGGLAVNNVPEPFGGEDPSGREVSPITGSVVKASGERWRLKVTNNSETDTYTVDVEVVQLNGNRAVVKRDAFTYTLKPKSSKEGSVGSGVGTMTAQLKLSSYHNLTVRNVERAAAEAKRLEVIQQSQVKAPQSPSAVPVQAKKPDATGGRAVVKVDGKTVEYDPSGAVKTVK